MTELPFVELLIVVEGQVALLIPLVLQEDVEGVCWEEYQLARLVEALKVCLQCRP